VFLVQSIFQDGLDTFVEEAVDGEGVSAGGFETFFEVLFSQADDAQAGAETLLEVGFGFQNVGDAFFGVGAGLGRPADDSGRGPFEVTLMAILRFLNRTSTVVELRRTSTDSLASG
jgi:hypothetical protein